MRLLMHVMIYRADESHYIVVFVILDFRNFCATLCIQDNLPYVLRCVCKFFQNIELQKKLEFG